MERNVHEKSNHFQTKKLRIATNLFNIMINQTQILRDFDLCLLCAAACSICSQN